MDESDGLLNVPPPEDTDILGQASRSELLDISSNSIVHTPMEPATSCGASSSHHNDETDPQLRITAAEEENLHLALAMNEAMSELVCNMIEKAEMSLKANLDKQKVLEERKKIFNSNAAMVKRKVPVNMFMPPYFKDQHNMCPPQNGEMKRKLECMIYDPLLKEEKKWSENDLRTLRRAVKESIVEDRLMTIYGKRELIQEKIRAADATTTAEERQTWNDKLDYFARRIEFEKTLSDDAILTGDYSRVDWATIAMVHFKGQRTPDSLRLKWCNEQSPQWSKSDWTATEVKKLNELTKTDFVSWSLIADELGTRRTAWQCFEKYKSEISNEILKREWTQEEDERLVKLVESLQLNGVIQWDKVTYHMAGRTRQQCRTRYLRTLDKSIKHGRWTDEEDLLLMCSIGRYGAKDWRKIARGVPGRNDGQCRERWVNVLDRSNRSEEWTMEEDEKLLYAVNMFGKGQWAKISSVLPGRNQRTCKARFRSLMTTKMRICAAQLSKIREAQAVRKGKMRVNLKKKPEGVFREFNKIVGGDDETGASFCDQARAIAQKEQFRWKQVDPDMRRVVEEGMHGIAKKYEQRRRGWSEVSDGQGEELFNNIEQTESMELRRKAQAWLPVEFDPDVTEEEKSQRLTEALCQVVGKQDQLRSVNTQGENDDKARKEVEETLRRILIDAVHSRVQMGMENAVEEDDQPSTSKKAAAGVSEQSLEAALRRDMQSAAEAAANDMLHPTATTAHAAELLLVEIPRIAEIATPLLASLWSGEKLSSMDEVLAHLSATLKHHQEYLELRETMRCLLVEPLMLIFSLEDDDRKKVSLMEEFNGYRDQLMGDVQNGKIIEHRARNKESSKTVGKSVKSKAVKKNKKNVEGEMDKEDDRSMIVPPTERKEKGSIWDEVDDEEIPIDWEEEPTEQPESQTPSRAKSLPNENKRRGSSMGGMGVKKEKKPPVKRSRSAKSAAPDDIEKEGEETVGKPPVKRGRSTRNSMSSIPIEEVVAEGREDDGGEEDTVDEVVKTKKTPAKRGRSTGNSMSSIPIEEVVADERIEGEGEEDTVDEIVKTKKTPAKRGRSTRNSMSSIPIEEVVADERIEGEGEEDKVDEVVKTKKTPAKRGRSTRNSMSSIPIEEVVAEGREDDGGEEDTVDEEVKTMMTPAKRGRSSKPTSAKRAKVMEEEENGEDGEETTPKRGRGRPRKSTSLTKEVEEKEKDVVDDQEKTVEDTEETKEAEDNTLPREDSVAVEKDGEEVMETERDETVVTPGEPEMKKSTVDAE